MFKICDFWCTVWRNIWKAEVSICYALKSFKLQLRRIIRYIKHNLWHKNTWLWVLWSNHSAALRQLSAPSVCSLFECWAAVLFSSVSLFMCSLCLSLSVHQSLSWPPSVRPLRVAPRTWARTLPSTRTPQPPTACGRKASTQRSKIHLLYLQTDTGTLNYI